MSRLGVAALITGALLPPRRYFPLAALCSAALLGGAFAFQYVGGLAPCELCHYQRMPYAAVIVIAGAGALLYRRLPWPVIAGGGVLCAGLFAGDAAIAAFHVGVEQGWWSGLERCSAATTPLDDMDSLRDAVFAAPAAFCDDIPWSLLGVSMAGWNGLAALFLTVLSFLAVSGWRR